MSIPASIIISALGVSHDQANALARSSEAKYSNPNGGHHFSWGYGANAAGYQGTVMSAYYHPSRAHTATSEGLYGPKRMYGNAGEWAVSHQPVDTTSNSRNRAFYNTL
jgi:hypothetical protein